MGRWQPAAVHGRRPALALTAAISVDLLGLVVKKHNPRRVGKVDPGRGQGVLERGDNPALGADHADLRRVRPPTHLDVYARSRERPSERFRRRIALDALYVQKRLHDQVAGGRNIVAVADADLTFRAPSRERGPHGHGPGVDVAVRDHDKLSVVSPDQRGPRFDPLHRTLKPSGHDLVAGLERLAV